MKEILNKYIEEGWVISQSHPTLPLVIYNYSQSTQYEGKWDEITLMCRGLILDTEGNIVVKPFGKFFNYEEVPDKVPFLTSEYVYVQDKLDGSFGLVFYYADQWVIATRGSFTSDQAVRAQEIFNKMPYAKTLMKEFAYLIEIIYPENRIVVDYGSAEKLMFLSVVTSESLQKDKEGVKFRNEELNWTTAKSILNASGVPAEYIVNTEMYENLSHELYKILKAKNTNNEEGFVLRFYPSNFRVKIKFEDYVALHRVLTNCSSYDIWENLMNFGKLPEAFLNDVPDEFYNWVREVSDNLWSEYNFIEATLKAEFKLICKKMKTPRPAQEEFLNRNSELARSYNKEFAERVKNHRLRGLLFSINNENDYSQSIWRMIKPVYSKPFSNK